MGRVRRLRLVGGLLLILLGIAALVLQSSPSWKAYISGLGWPLYIIGAGISLFIIGLLAGAPSMAVLACLVAGIGGLLSWQNATGDWNSWSYAWTLIVGFVGVGGFLQGLLEGNLRMIGHGAWYVFISLVLFVVVGSLLGGVSVFGPYWPVSLIVLGLVLFGRSLARAY